MKSKPKPTSPFVNPKKRSVQLPNGSKDLADVLQSKHRKRRSNGKCEYCDAPAVAMSYLWFVDERYCRECWLDLRDYAAKKVFKFDYDPDDKAAVSRFRKKEQKAQDEFMRQRVKERKSQ